MQVSRAWVKVIVVWEGQGVPLTNSITFLTCLWRIKAAVWPSDDVSTVTLLFVMTFQPTLYSSLTLQSTDDVLTNTQFFTCSLILMTF